MFYYLFTLFVVFVTVTFCAALDIFPVPPNNIANDTPINADKTTIATTKDNTVIPF